MLSPIRQKIHDGCQRKAKETVTRDNGEVEIQVERQISLGQQDSKLIFKRHRLRHLKNIFSKFIC